jgi:hypothetical protein
MFGSGNNELRQKLINLMYIVFITLAFIYLPSDFVDSSKYISLSLYNNGNEYQKKIADKDEFLDEQLYLNSPLAQDYYNIVDVKDAIDSTTLLVENMLGLLYSNMGGYNKNNYLKGSKNFLVSGRLFVKEGNTAATLKNNIEDIKQKMRTYNLTGIILNLDSILPTAISMRGSNGKERLWENYFFNKVPAAVAITNLLKIRSDLLYTKYKLVEYLVNNISKTKAENGISILSSNSIGIEVLASKNFILGDKVAFRLVMLDSSRGFDNVKTYVKQGNKTIKELKAGVNGMVSFTANQTGKFEFVVIDSIKVVKKDFTVTNLRTAVPEKNKPEVLYMGIDNPIQLQYTELNRADLVLEIDLGEIIPFGGKYYLRFAKEGFAHLRVYSTNPDGRFLVTEKEYEVKKLPIPVAKIDNRMGGNISRKILQVQDKLVVQSEEPGLDEAYIIISYDVIKVGSYTKESTVNKGKDFSSETRKMVRDVKTGDLLVFDNIKVEGTDGALKEIAPIVFSVK